MISKALSIIILAGGRGRSTASRDEIDGRGGGGGGRVLEKTTTGTEEKARESEEEERDKAEPVVLWGS